MKEEKKITKTQQRLLMFSWEKKWELQLRGSGRNTSSGLSRKKWAGLCLEGLWTCLVDDNSQVDACLAGALLTLPPTLSAPPHLNHLHLIRFPRIYYSFHPLFTVSHWPLTCCRWDLYFLHNCVYHFKRLCEKKGGISYFRFSNNSGACPLICLGKAIWLTLHTTDIQLGGLLTKHTSASLPYNVAHSSNAGEDKKKFRII